MDQAKLLKDLKAEEFKIKIGMLRTLTDMRQVLAEHSRHCDNPECKVGVQLVANDGISLEAFIRGEEINLLSSGAIGVRNLVDLVFNRVMAAAENPGTETAVYASIHCDKKMDICPKCKIELCEKEPVDMPMCSSCMERETAGLFAVKDNGVQ